MHFRDRSRRRRIGIPCAQVKGAEPVMVNFKVAVRTTVLLVDDDTCHIELRTRAMEMSGFSVVNATSPLEAIAIMYADSCRKIHVAVIDYDMPVMNGCILADYLRTRYPELRIVLYSGTLDIPEQEMASVDAFVAKSSGVFALIAKITDFEQLEPADSTLFNFESSTSIDAVN
jgi:CheY-like chemotaxis protein